MITEDYVSFETAKLLNAKGFKGEFHKHFWGYEPGKEFLTSGSFNPEYDYPAPTLQMAMKWLREEKKLNCFTDVSFNQDRNGETEYYFFVWENKPPYELLKENSQTFSTYEEACEAAIKYCLENLI